MKTDDDLEQALDELEDEDILDCYNEAGEWSGVAAMNCIEARNSDECHYWMEWFIEYIEERGGW